MYHENQITYWYYNLNEIQQNQAVRVLWVLHCMPFFCCSRSLAWRAVTGTASAFNNLYKHKSKNIYLYFMSFLHINMTPVIEILP